MWKKYEKIDKKCRFFRFFPILGGVEIFFQFFSKIKIVPREILRGKVCFASKKFDSTKKLGIFSQRTPKNAIKKVHFAILTHLGASATPNRSYWQGV